MSGNLQVSNGSGQNYIYSDDTALNIKFDNKVTNANEQRIYFNCQRGVIHQDSLPAYWTMEGNYTSAYSILEFRDSASSYAWQIHYRASTPATRSMAWYYYNGSAWDNLMYLDTSGNLYIKGTYGNISSIRFKDYVKPFNENVLDKVLAMKVRRFKFKNSEKELFGLIAEEMPKELQVLDGDGEVIGYNMSGLVIYLLKALQELYIELQKLKRGEAV